MASDDMADRIDEKVPPPMRPFHSFLYHGSITPWEPVTMSASEPPKKVWAPDRRDILHYRWAMEDGTWQHGYVAWPEKDVPRHPELQERAQQFFAELTALTQRYGASIQGCEDGEVIIELDGKEVGDVSLNNDGLEFSPAITRMDQTLDEGLAEYEEQIKRFESIMGQEYPADLKERVLRHRA